ncbi:MAG: alpha/beta hydrolase [Pseudomonadota bacterium]
MIYCFHGLIGSPAHWRLLQTCASQPIKAPKIDYVAEPFEAILERLKREISCVREPVTLVGNSLGCVLALRLQDLGENLVLTAPPFEFDSSPLKLGRTKISDYIDTLYVRQGIPGLPRLKAEAEVQLKELLSSRAMLRHIRRLKSLAQTFEDPAALAAAGSKVTFVLGADDYATPVAAFRAFARRSAPRARLKVVSDCGHALPVEAPSELLKIIEDAEAVRRGPHNTGDRMFCRDLVGWQHSTLV